jgi:hypothetical protein
MARHVVEVLVIRLLLADDQGRARRDGRLARARTRLGGVAEVGRGEKCSRIVRHQPDVRVPTSMPGLDGTKQLPG